MTKVSTIVFSCLFSVSLLSACGSRKDDGNTGGAMTSAEPSEELVAAGSCESDLAACLATATASQAQVLQCLNNLDAANAAAAAAVSQTAQCQNNLNAANAAAAAAVAQTAQCQNNLNAANAAAAAATLQATTATAALNAANASLAVCQASLQAATADADGDGVPNLIDTCAGTPAGQLVDPHGCPRPLVVTFPVTNQWATGYCVTIGVTNTGAQATTSYTLTLNTGASTINAQRWNGTFSASTGNVTVTPAAFHKVIAPGATDTQMGFCADRPSGSGALPTFVSATASF